MNSLVESVLMNDEILTVASFGANAGAGGVFLGLACDFAVASERVVLNPHYKTMGLSGSEYHSYTLPLRVTEERAREILEEALPMSAKHAKEISMIDEVLPVEDYMRHLYTYCEALLSDEERYYELLDEKRERLKRDAEKIVECRERELSRMHPQFWDPDSDFHRLRHEFVYKICHTKAPERLWRSQ
jgi:putative two-component system hydrogenase maturation factor HypX/HoxX